MGRETVIGSDEVEIRCKMSLSLGAKPSCPRYRMRGVADRAGLQFSFSLIVCPIQFGLRSTRLR